MDEFVLRRHENQCVKRDPILTSKGFLNEEYQKKPTKSAKEVNLTAEDLLAHKLRGLFAEKLEPNPWTKDAVEVLEKELSEAYGKPWKDDRDYTLLTFSGYYTKDRDQLLAINYWTTFSFLMDDLLINEKDRNVTSKWSDKYKSGKTTDSTAMDKMMTKAMEYMKKTLSAAQYDRHVQHVVDWIDSYVEINNYDFDDKVMSYEQFFDLREKESAHGVLAICAEMSCAYDPTVHKMVDNKIYKAYVAALGRHTVLVNEIYGLKKRLRDGRLKYSYLYLIMAHEGCSAQTAMDRMVYEIHDAWTIAMNYAEQIRLMKDKAIYEYVLEMVCLTKGNLYWAFKTRRYIV
ncbi:unnamed protein product [Oppiella nova]|uniref:Terpene synthase n=1 Tax=Oppiella nova TaxID=334625 RepID=A0A7R9QVK5_9ACAR|nr:unnamed protein product [Oppiella nova]CAG2175586.1 unnamed protein product [Oppiella nova]